MDLIEYISDRTRRAQLAADLDKNPNYLWQVATGRRRASIDLAKLIHRKTRGVVHRGSLRPDAWPLPVTRRG